MHTNRQIEKGTGRDTERTTQPATNIPDRELNTIPVTTKMTDSKLVENSPVASVVVRSML